MSGFELNKIFAAVLVAGIVAMLGGFIADVVIHPHALEKDAVFIDGADIAAGGAVKQSMPEPVLHLIAAADIAKGEKLSKACASCHSFEKNGPVKTGPTLWGVVGAPMGAKGGYDYSKGMSGYGKSWGYLELNKFLWKPKKFISDTKMNYIGLKKPEDRAAMIAWLRTLGSGEPLPSAAEIAEEVAELAPPEKEVVEEALEAIQDSAQ